LRRQGSQALFIPRCVSRIVEAIQACAAVHFSKASPPADSGGAGFRGRARGVAEPAARNRLNPRLILIGRNRANDEGLVTHRDAPGLLGKRNLDQSSLPVPLLLAGPPPARQEPAAPIKAGA